MIIISHRVNSKEELKKLNPKYGVEVDLRDYKNEIQLTHDPFKKGLKFENYLKLYKHSFIICNIKSERIEFKVLKILKRFKIKNYFFLDSSFPMKVICLKKNIYNQSIRYSKYENVPKTNFFNKIKWIWYDTFDGLPKTHDLIKLKKSKRKICLVCPKLHNKSFKNSIIHNFLKKNSKFVDMVCTKKKKF